MRIRSFSFYNMQVGNANKMEQTQILIIMSFVIDQPTVIVSLRTCFETDASVFFIVQQACRRCEQDGPTAHFWTILSFADDQQTGAV